MPLSRRQFLLGGLGAAGAGAAGLVLTRGGTPPLRAAAPAKPGTPAAAGVTSKDGILVLLTLYGGNDGLNTVIPYQDGAYLGGRSSLGYQPSEVLPLDGELGLHPSLTGLKGLWDVHQLAIVRGVGYPEPNRSHFRSMDIWQTGAPDTTVSSGWVGRWLDRDGNDPMRAVSIGGSLPRVFGGDKAAGAAVPAGPLTLPGGAAVAAGFTALSAATPGAALLAARVAQSGSDLLHVQGTLADLLAAVPEKPEEAPAAASLEGGAAERNPLAAQLDLVARLVKGGSPTRVYGVRLGGFDTHANEKETHARLLGQVDAAVSGFFEDLGDGATAFGRNVVLVAYSEFGRRVKANASGGTDHGTAAPVLVAGPPVRGGFYGDEPRLNDLDDGDLRFTTDFRSVYATLLQEVLGVEAKVALGKDFPAVPFL